MSPVLGLGEQKAEVPMPRSEGTPPPESFPYVQLQKHELNPPLRAAQKSVGFHHTAKPLGAPQNIEALIFSTFPPLTCAQMKSWQEGEQLSL